MPRVLITRAPHQASPLADTLRALGCKPILIPTIELDAPTSFHNLDVALSSLDDFDWLLFTSANAVEAFVQRATKELGALIAAKDLLRRNSTRIASIGPATTRALEAAGLTPTLTPPQAVAESLAAALLPHALQPNGTSSRFLLVRAETARDVLPETLRAAGADVSIAAAYRTIIPASSIDALRQLFRYPTHYPDAITFTSGSTATNLLTLLHAAGLTLPPEITRASIGPITSQVLRDADLPPHIEAPEATVASLAQALATYLQHR